MKLLYTMLVSIILLSTSQASPPPPEFPRAVLGNMINDTMKIQHGEDNNRRNYHCLTPDGGATGDPYYAGQGLAFSACTQKEAETEAIQYFFYKDGEMFLSAINSLYGSGQSHDYCLSLSENGIASLQSCNPDDPAQQIRMYQRAKSRTLFRSSEHMCLAQGENYQAIALACDEYDPAEWMNIEEYLNPTEVYAYNDSYFKWVEVRVDKRLNSHSQFSYRQKGQLDTGFIFPGSGWHLDVDFESLGWYSRVGISTDEAGPGVGLRTWVTGYWNLYAHIKIGQADIPAKECAKVYSSGPGGFNVLISRTVQYDLVNGCRKAVVFTLFFTDGSQTDTETRTVQSSSTTYIHKDIKWTENGYVVRYQ